MGGSFIKTRAADGVIEKLAQENLPDQLAPAAEILTMTSYTPRNELDTVADILYEQSNLSLSDIAAEIAIWPYERKLQVMQAYLIQEDSKSALSNCVYSWDMLTSFVNFNALAQQSVGSGQKWQALTPRYGYAVPQVVDEAGLTELFEQCFDISLQLYSQLQAAGYHSEAQYATLLGHRVRWSLNCTAADITKLQGHKNKPELQQILKQMHDKIAEVHPIIAENLDV